MLSACVCACRVQWRVAVFVCLSCGGDAKMDFWGEETTTSFFGA